jgi:hypothetical protein
MLTGHIVTSTTMAADDAEDNRTRYRQRRPWLSRALAVAAVGAVLVLVVWLGALPPQHSSSSSSTRHSTAAAGAAGAGPAATTILVRIYVHKVGMSVLCCRKTIKLLASLPFPQNRPLTTRPPSSPPASAPPSPLLRSSALPPPSSRSRRRSRCCRSQGRRRRGKPQMKIRAARRRYRPPARTGGTGA